MWCELCGNTGMADMAQISAQDEEGNKIHKNYLTGYCWACQEGKNKMESDREMLKRESSCQFLPKHPPEGYEFIKRKNPAEQKAEEYRRKEIDDLIARTKF